jgi:hypothetical protein
VIIYRATPDVPRELVLPGAGWLVRHSTFVIPAAAAATVAAVALSAASRLKSVGEDPFAAAGTRGLCGHGGRRPRQGVLRDRRAAAQGGAVAGMPVAWRRRRRTSVSSRWATWEAAASA